MALNSDIIKKVKEKFEPQVSNEIISILVGLEQGKQFKRLTDPILKAVKTNKEREEEQK